MSKTHLAAIIPQKGGPLSVQERPTPEPGPNEVLIEIKAVALNPIDHAQRDIGLFLSSYPAVIGCDAAGVVVKLGPGVTTVPGPGSRVLALATGFYCNFSPDHGAFQQYALAQSETVVPLPDGLSFEEGAICPLATVTALSAWTSIGIPLSTRYAPEDKEAVLIWGGASSVGSFAVQSARDLGFRVYVTASPRHHDYMRRLGAHDVFDYRDPDVVSRIIAAAKRDGVRLRTAHCVVPGSLQPTLDVLTATKGGPDAPARIAHSPVLPNDHPTLDSTQIAFTMPPSDPAARDDHLFQCLHKWLGEGLKSGSVVPSPGFQIEGGGLEGLNAALDKLRAGVSGTKIVVPL
ncbi:hypothetical protein VTH82DRAFT_6348 [Thermothelomyces myriococcoides]